MSGNRRRDSTKENQGPSRRTHLPAAAGVAAASLALYAWTACPTVPFGDGGELIAAAHGWGVAHPPGYPLYTLLAKLALLAPLGEPALRVNLLSGLAAAAACGLVAWCAARWSGSTIGAVAAGAGLAVSSTLWSVATVAEVYALHVLLVLALVCLADRAGTSPNRKAAGRAALAFGVALGLGLAHHPTIVLALPAAAVLAWPRRPPRDSRSLQGLQGSPGARLPVAAWALAALVAAAIAVALDATLLLRARAAPLASWGAIEDFRGLAVHVTARAYRVYDLGWTGLARTGAWEGLGRHLARELGPAGIPLALAGAAWGADRRRIEPGRIRLALALLFSTHVLFGLRYATEDAQVYLLPSFVALALAAGLGVAALEHGWRRRALTGASRLTARQIAAGVSVLLLVLPPALRHEDARNLRHLTAAADYGRDVLASVPRDGVLFAEGDDAFLLAYLIQVLGERPDVTVYDRGGHLFRDLLREGGVQPRGGDRLDAQARAEAAFLAAERSQPVPRPISFLAWPGYDPPQGLRFEPFGLVYRLTPQGSAPLYEGSLRSRSRASRLASQASRLEDPFALTVAATYPLLDGERLLFLGDREGAFAAFERARRLGPTETILNSLGTIYGRLGDYSRAAAAFEEALRIKPVSPRARANLALARRLAAQAQPGLPRSPGEGYDPQLHEPQRP